MITRYSRPEMRAIWTDENKLRLWLQIELLASAALVKERIVPAKDFAKIKAGCNKWFADLPGLVARQRELEKTLNHDVIGFTTAVAEKINDNASRWFHFGLTSSDIVDTTFAVQMVQSADLLIADVRKLLPTIARRAKAGIRNLERLSTFLPSMFPTSRRARNCENEQKPKQPDVTRSDRQCPLCAGFQFSAVGLKPARSGHCRVGWKFGRSR